MVRQIFQLARYGCTLRITSQTSIYNILVIYVTVIIVSWIISVPWSTFHNQHAMLHCRVIPTKHTECIGCISQLHPVCPCKFIGDSTLSKSSLTVSGPRGWIVREGGNGRI
jgi:hypothetical protein